MLQVFHKKPHFIFVFILAVGILFRIYHLGYSNFQGDEVAAQNYLFDERSFGQFLLTRTIGPGQYTVSAAFNTLFLENAEARVGTRPGTELNPEFFQRLPFALAGVATLAIVTHMMLSGFNDVGCESRGVAAVIAVTLLSVSGLLIAFSRLVQYQAFIMLIALATIYALHRYLTSEKSYFLTLAAILAGVGLLFHYDSLSFILPITLMLLVKKDFEGFAAFSLIVGAVASLFYIPFALSQPFRETAKYLLGERLTSGFHYDSAFYTIKLLAIYHSKELLVIFLAGLVLIGTSLYKSSLATLPKRTKQVALLGFAATLAARIVLKEYSPLLASASVVLLGVYSALHLVDIAKQKYSFSHLLTVWFLVSFGAYVVTIRMPLTHFYNALTPFLMLCSIHFAKFYKESSKPIKAVAVVVFCVVVMSSLSFNYSAFLHTAREYPWEAKAYMFGEMPSGIVDGENIRGIFGFPYQRGWHKIRTYFDPEKTGQIVTYDSNEKYRLAKYYMKPNKWIPHEACYFVFIERPQSLIGFVRPRMMPVYEEKGFAIFRLEKSPEDDCIWLPAHREQGPQTL